MALGVAWALDFCRIPRGFEHAYGWRTIPFAATGSEGAGGMAEVSEPRKVTVHPGKASCACSALSGAEAWAAAGTQ